MELHMSICVAHVLMQESRKHTMRACMQLTMCDIHDFDMVYFFPFDETLIMRTGETLEKRKSDRQAVVISFVPLPFQMMFIIYLT